MKNILRYVLISIIPWLLACCGKDNGTETPTNTYSLNREDIIGCWKVIQAKYDEDAKMTDWAFEDTYASFEENGLYKGEGYFGNGEGTYSVAGNIITTKVDNVPYIVYEVTGLEGDKANLTATLQKNQLKIWMVCQKVENIEVTPPSSITDETVFNSETNVIAVLGSIYNNLAKSAHAVSGIETDILAGKFDKLSPNSTEIKTAWEYAYKSLNQINTALDALSDETKFNSKILAHKPHFIALRAYVAFTLSSLWGDVPYTEHASPLDNIPKITPASDILKGAIKDLELSSTSYTFGSSEEWRYLNPTARDILLGEIAMTAGDKEKAINHLNINLDNYTTGNSIFVFAPDTQAGQEDLFTAVYLTENVGFMMREVKDDTDGLIESWKSLPVGLWKALKRMGKAEEVTGCQTYQLLFPYPHNDAEYYVHQNPGY